MVRFYFLIFCDLEQCLLIFSWGIWKQLTVHVCGGTGLRGYGNDCVAGLYDGQGAGLQLFCSEGPANAVAVRSPLCQRPSARELLTAGHISVLHCVVLWHEAAVL